MGFEALDNALQLPAVLAPLMPRVKAGNADLADQIVRAVNSVALNVLEASGRTGRDRSYRYRIALGSAKEVVAGVKLAVGWGWLESGDVQVALARLDRTCALVYGLTRT